MFADRVEYNRASSVSYFHSRPVALTATDRILFLNRGVVLCPTPQAGPGDNPCRDARPLQ